MTSNCLRALFALVVCVVSVRFIRAEEPAETPCPDDVSVSSSIVEETENEFVVELTITGRSEQGVPMLSKIPYLNRLFKNVGVGRVTTSVAVPKHEVIGVDFDIDTETPPEPYYLEDDIQYFPGEHPVDLPAALVTWQQGRDLAHCVSKTRTKAKKSSKAKRGGRNCKRCSCECGNSKEVRTAKLQKQLMIAVAENAQLHAWADAREEIAQAKEQFLHEMMEAKVEIVRLQMQAEGKIARRHKHGGQYDQPVDEHHHTAIRDLQLENARLKAIIAELENQTRRR